MYKVYVKEEHGMYVLVEKGIKREEVQSKIDEYIKEGYMEVMVLNDFSYVMGKIAEKCKVLKK